MKKEKINGKKLIKEWVIKNGFTPDNFGHFQKESMGVDMEMHKYRYKMGKNKVRKEVKVGNTWVRIFSGLYSELSVNDEGKLVGMKTRY